MSKYTNYENFREELIEKIKLQTVKDVELKKVLKNNGIILEALLIKDEDSMVAPTIYIEPFYDQYLDGKKLSEIVEDILNLSESRPAINFLMNEFKNWETAKKKICYKLINKENNQELLKDVPFTEILNLAVVYYYICEKSENQQSAMILIHNSQLEYWNITKQQLDEVARKNTPAIQKAQIFNMADILQDIAGESFECDEIPMYVVTNENKQNGAGCVLYPNLLKEFAEKQDTDFYILPSSIHEALLLPVNVQSDVQELLDMVKEVNETQVEKEERLADNVYYYDRKDDSLKIVA